MPPAESNLGRILKAIYIFVHVIVLGWAMLWGLGAVYAAMNGSGILALSQAVVGALLLFLVFRGYKSTWSVVRGQTPIRTIDKISAVIILIGFVIFGFFIYSSLPYFTRPWKEQKKALAVINEKIPDYDAWASWDQERRKSALPTLITLLGHEERKVRNQTAYSIGTIGEEAAEAVPALLEMMKNERSVPSAAANALARLGAPGREALASLLNDPDRWLRDAADYALNKQR